MIWNCSFQERKAKKQGKKKKQRRKNKERKQGRKRERKKKRNRDRERESEKVKRRSENRQGETKGESVKTFCVLGFFVPRKTCLTAQPKQRATPKSPQNIVKIGVSVNTQKSWNQIKVMKRPSLDTDNPQNPKFQLSFSSNKQKTPQALETPIFIVFPQNYKNRSSQT